MLHSIMYIDNLFYQPILCKETQTHHVPLVKIKQYIPLAVTQNRDDIDIVKIVLQKMWL